MSEHAASRYPYYKHDDGLVVTQPRPSEFEERPMTAGELAAREPALAIAKDIYRHANQAGVCYYEFWMLISKAIDETVARSETASREARLLWLETLLKHCPHAELKYIVDADEGDGPVGFSLIVQSCSRLELRAPTLNELIDLGMKAQPDEDGNVIASAR